jgi:hypothetical protein
MSLFQVRWIVLLTSALLALQGCASWLPQASADPVYFTSFDQARAAIESIEPGRTRTADLKAMHLDTVQQPNTVVLSYADILRRVMGGSVLAKQDLAPGIVQCLEAHDACRGLEFNINSIHKDRVGSFWLDFINFKRETVTSGWRFNALILSVDEVVVYRSWGGQPEVHWVDKQRNPLGPLQEIGPAIVTSH